jgi:CheY-like chemotaxis protein
LVLFERVLYHRLAGVERRVMAGRKQTGASGSPSRRVVVADDNVYMTRSLSLVLAHWGFEVTVAHDGPAALAAVRSLRPHAVLLDIRLPMLDGLAVARRIREEPDLANVLLVAITGYSEASDRERSLDAGFDHHLVKPVDPDVLRAALARG